ncbi:MAG TPA: endonuclease/exonuclease/phosphatase family protein [Saprospiraceae bacterium]|nr:endonuclease/exonuclease/phosphatase family protein [Saprospiraceae bacterium]HMT51981.1 endonuclease/exonuclease/phosphatase family protein [Saprospiraceae bacterium]HMT69069.1 endonuclease/exonuclease/phosphatase family protein [Saprospiraceae bacterium]
MKLFDRTIFLINFGVILATFLAYLAPNIDPELTWTIAFFGLFYPVLLIINVLFIVYWLFKKPKYSIASILCIILGWNQVKGFISFNAQKPETQGETVSVITYNISNAYFGYDKNKKNRDKKKETFIEFLENYKETEIFCIQEVGDYAYDILKKTFPDHHLYYKEKGAVILSKYPIIKKGEVDFGTKTNSCLWGDIKIHGDTLRVYSFHLQSNQISADTEKLANQREINQKQAWYDIKGILRKFRNKHLHRSRQAEKIAAHVKKSPHKIILGGDLNDPPQSYTYQVFSTLGNDAFRERGSGIGTTYAGRIPLLRIDYIFADKALEVASYELIKDHFSDHYAVSATLEWPIKEDIDSEQ